MPSLPALLRSHSGKQHRQPQSGIPQRRSSWPSVEGTARRNSSPPALALAGALPPTAWLEQALAAERESLMHYLERRHQLLLLDMQAKIRDDFDDDATGEYASGNGQSDPEGTGPSSPSSRTLKRGSTVSTLQDSEAELPTQSNVTDGTEGAMSTSAEPRRFRSSGTYRSQSSHKLFTSEEMKEHNTFANLVRDAKFELAMACIIIANSIVMAFQFQYEGMGLGHDLRYRWYSSPSEQIWEGSDKGIETMDYVFGAIFTLELVVKMLGLRAKWFSDPWNYLDAAIVGLWLVEKPLQDTLQLPTDAAILRMARLFRILRLLRLLRTIQGFDDLYLLLTTLKGSMLVLGWSCILLFFAQMLIAMVFWLILKETYFFNDFYPLRERQQVFEYFGTFTRTMLTMFEMTLANWPPVCRLLVENVNEWFSLFCIMHKLTMGFAVIGAINGVLIQETFKAAASDDRVMLRQREREVKVHTGKLKRFFAAADESGDGVVDRQEFRQILQDSDILMWLASMEITVEDPDVLFSLLDTNGNDELSQEELVRGVLYLRGSARSIDVLELKKQVEYVKSKMM